MNAGQRTVYLLLMADAIAARHESFEEGLMPSVFCVANSSNFLRDICKESWRRWAESEADFLFFFALRMTSGRPPLDPQTKLIHRQESLKRYAVKHSDALRASAAVRMQRLRAANKLSSQESTSKRQSAARYRAKHREEIRERDSQYRKHKAEAARAQSALGGSTAGVYGIYGVQARDLVNDKRATKPHRPKTAVVSNAERSRRQLETAHSSFCRDHPAPPEPRQPKPLNLDEYPFLSISTPTCGSSPSPGFQSGRRSIGATVRNAVHTLSPLTFTTNQRTFTTNQHMSSLPASNFDADTNVASVSDLQRGEHHANLDFITCSHYVGDEDWLAHLNTDAKADDDEIPNLHSVRCIMWIKIACQSTFVPTIIALDMNSESEKRAVKLAAAHQSLCRARLQCYRTYHEKKRICVHGTRDDVLRRQRALQALQNAVERAQHRYNRLLSEMNE
ncbi:hypothetical protein C8R43DRAFT_950846 [Mycena crocata]|nr:hypothetical protein C8R43DRAFT_950846 [Mycena crocata]